MQWQPVPKDAALKSLQLPAIGSKLSPDACKNLALILAYRGIGQVAPNPLVGAVLVDAEHQFIGAGAHEKIGQAHAEINAISHAEQEQQGGRIKGGTLYVTLEPCAHTNRTPACALTLAATGLSKVVYGLVDPNPKVHGRGAQILQQAGISAELDGGWSPACAELAEIFLHNIRYASPFVGLKVALSLDGLIALPGAQRAWITGPRARAYGHFLRVYYEALIIGRGTLFADDPCLDARDSLWQGRAPRRVVLDPDASGLMARPPQNWRLLNHDPAGVIWLTGDKISRQAELQAQRLTAAGAAWRALPRDADGSFTPSSILKTLWQLNVTSVLLEGGAGVYGPFLKAAAVQRLHAFQAAKILGAADGLRFAAGAGEVRPSGPARITPLGEDWLVEMPLAHQEKSL